MAVSSIATPKRLVSGCPLIKKVATRQVLFSRNFDLHLERRAMFFYHPFVKRLIQGEEQNHKRSKTTEKYMNSACFEGSWINSPVALGTPD